jgi:hypothetical protein
MKRALLLTLGILALASLSMAQPFAGIYTDNPGFSDCNLEDVGPPGLCSVYLVQGGTSGISSQMMVEDNSGLTSTGVVVHTLLSIGNVFTGVDFSYGACLSPPILLATLNYFCQGTAAPCSNIRVVPHPQTGVIIAVTCAPVAVDLTPMHLTINGDSSCPCGVPVEESSWGQIKALYTD